MKYSDEEVDAVALAILNMDRKGVGLLPAKRLTEASVPPTVYRLRAEAALEARDALFETVGERWEVRCMTGEYAFSRASEDEALELVERRRQGGYRSRVVHVTTKRRKR